MGCINDPPCVSVTVCQQIIMYVVTFIPKMCKKARNYSLPVLKWQHTGSISKLQINSENCMLSVVKQLLSCL